MKSRILFPALQLLALILAYLSSSTIAVAKGPAVRLVQAPSLSPDGKKIAFSWMGEIWTCKLDGSKLTRLTNHESTDSQPVFSPNGKQIAFVSNRTGSSQIFVMDSRGSTPRQLTYHSAGYQLTVWFPDGNSLLAIGARDHFWRGANRMLRISVKERRAEEVLADATAADAKVSPDGKHILFGREGERWWRKGYQGERAAQIWKLDLNDGHMTELLHEGVGCRWPCWMDDGSGFYFAKGDVHGLDLWKTTLVSGEEGPIGKQEQVVNFEEDSVAFPTISRDGSTIVFRHLFDLYSFRPGKDKQPVKIEINANMDAELPDDMMRREFSTASEVAFTDDGLEIAFIAGGDVWVMDTKLREPVRVTETGGYEENLLFSKDAKHLYFTAIHDGQVDVYRATRGDEDRYWWQNEEFAVEQLTEDMHVESDLRLTPNEKQLVFQQGRGDLAILDLESKKKRKLISGFSGISYDISSDSRWIAYDQQDDDFNSDIWIRRLDGEGDPVNVSRHPDNDRGPKFSPDGKILAFTGRQIAEEYDIYYVYLQEEKDEETSRQRRLEEAIELMKKKRKTESPNAKESAGKKSDEEKQGEKKGNEKEAADDEKTIEIDLADIHKRVRKISIPDSFESGLLFSPDGKKLAFNASIDGKRGWYTVEFPDALSPKFLTSSTGSNVKWSKAAGGLLYSRSGVPAKLETSGKLETYSFTAAQELSRSEWLKAGFEKAWLTMKEAWYDPRYNNRNWSEIRRKYVDMASEVHSTRELGSVVELMLGELNGSHLGFYPSGRTSRSSREGWTDQTAHLGVRFVEDHKGPGLLVRDVLPGGPADREDSKLFKGDVILAIDGGPVDPAMDLTEVLNGRLDRNIDLRVLRTTMEEAEEKTSELAITLRPTSFSNARGLLYEQWLEHNRKMVDEASEGKLGYLHIRAMNMSSFYDFERELYNVGYGRDGLVIDVRDNGGGSTTDLLLTALTQPRHAITVPRGGGQGYPHDRIVFASWNKPIIVLCNQNSYSNAEIFSHAIKTLGRGKVVGVQTAGGVVSTGSATINDVGRIRVPFRGWFVLGTGEDMELNGCAPDIKLWVEPGELPSGKDSQLAKAVELLLEDVAKAELGDKELIYASERDE